MRRLGAAVVLLGLPACWYELDALRASSYHEAITITAGANGMPADYAVALTFSHRALVGAGKMLESGADLHVLDDQGREIDRVLDTGSAWNQDDTKIWFRIASPLDPDATATFFLDQRSGVALEDPAKVFAFADGFEGALDRWMFTSKDAVTTTRAHGGDHALEQGLRDDTLELISVRGLDLGDVAFDAWWYVERFAPMGTLGALDVAQAIRANIVPDNPFCYFADLQPRSLTDPIPTLNLGKNRTPPFAPGASAYTELAPRVVVQVPATWFRITVYGYRDTMAVDLDGTRVVPLSGFSRISAMTSGTVGFLPNTLPGHLWIDDVTARPLVVPEPVVTLGL